MERFILFGLLSIPVVILSWRTLVSLKTHGIYRFVSWECIIWLFASNVRYWFVDASGVLQIFSWIFLCFSGYLVIAGAVLLKRRGRPVKNRRDNSALYGFEETSELVDSGIYRYIRHPLYASLLFLTWGIFLKNPTLFLLCISVLSTASLYMTALMDERECIRVFGEPYREYMRRGKRFIPYLI